jgi:hypothetical protein
VAGDQERNPAEHGEAALHRDHAFDVAAVAFAELGEDAVADRVELAAELLQALGAEVRQRALRMGVDRGGGGNLWISLSGKSVSGAA